MLQLQTVFPDTLELLRSLMGLPILQDMRLVGGTALALQYGHRRSVDLDFFGMTTEDANELTEALRSISNNIQQGNSSKRIKSYMIDNIKVDFVNYNYKWLEDAIIEDNIRLASPMDIAAMKMNAIMGRGTKKDFIDIYYLLKHYSFEDILQFYVNKYPEYSTYRAMLSMSYFEDADSQPMPYMFDNISWDRIKEHIKVVIREYNKRINQI